MTAEQRKAISERTALAKAHNEQLLKSLSVEEKSRQFDALVAKLDGSRAVKDITGEVRRLSGELPKYPSSSGEALRSIP